MPNVLPPCHHHHNEDAGHFHNPRKSTFLKLEVGGGTASVRKKGVEDIVAPATPLLPTRLQRSTTRQVALITCDVLIGGPRKTIPLAMGGTWPTLEPAVSRKRPKVEGEREESEVAALGPLCPHASAHACPRTPFHPSCPAHSGPQDYWEHQSMSQT